MKKSHLLTPADAAFIDAMCSSDPQALNQWAQSVGLDPVDPDTPVCLANLPPDQWVDNTNIIPTPAIQRYLDSGDILTHHTLNMMELAMERDFKVDSPWYITSTREGNEEQQSLKVINFYIAQEIEQP